MPDDVKQVTSDAVGSADKDYWWAARLQSLCRICAETTKYRDRLLTPEDIKSLEASKHYIELALNNDRLNKEDAA